MSALSTIIPRHTNGLRDRLQTDRGTERLVAAAATIRAVRLELEAHTGPEIAAVRELLAALEAGHRSIGDAESR